jgi:hypothetical protein
MDAERQLGSPATSTSDFLGPLYSDRNPTFPTFASEVVDYVMATLVGSAYFPDMQPDIEPDNSITDALAARSLEGFC